MITLRHGDATCTVSAEDGGRLVSIKVGEFELLRSRERDQDPKHWGSYPMVPWAGRVREGRFSFDSVEYQLDITLPPHAIHGTVYTQPWTVTAVDDVSVAMSCLLGDRWPFGGTAHQRIEIGDGHLHCSLGVTAGDRPMPAQVGWHPWFVKPDEADLRFGEMFQRDNVGIPSGVLVRQPAGPWDDCFRQPLAPLSLTYRGTGLSDGGSDGLSDGENLVVIVDSDADNWVVYDEPIDATCVEPQSGPPDGFSIEPQRLDPGETLERWMAIRWQVTAPR